jgi:hypothetical protein
MSNKKNERRGGARLGTGPKPGSGEMTKICVSVNEKNWNTAVAKWNKKPSWLVDRLVRHYVQTNGSILKQEAAI